MRRCPCADMHSNQVHGKAQMFSSVFELNFTNTGVLKHLNPQFHCKDIIWYNKKGRCDLSAEKERNIKKL